jgi:deoxyguanosine kinase
MAKKLTTAYIALGSNLGDSAALISRATQKLKDSPDIELTAVSSTIRTKPLASKDQPDYLNAVVKIQTNLTPDQLLKYCQTIEDLLGRTRTEKWSSRTMDLDILLYANEIIKTTDLTIPHSEMHLRSFALSGLAQLDPSLEHPILNCSVSELLSRLNGRDFTLDPAKPQLICIAGMIGVGKTTLAQKLAELLNTSLIREAYDTNPYIADEYAGRKEAALGCEMYFLDSRGEQLGKHNLSAPNVFVADYIFQKSMIFARWMLDETELKAYSKRYTATLRSIAQPALVIYMTDTAKNCLARIQKRDRSYEKQIDVQMLEGLSSGYEKLITEFKTAPVIRLPANEFDCFKTDHMNELTQQVKSYIWKS